MEPTTFKDLGLGPEALAAIERKGFEEPTPIQALCIPRLLAPGADLVARARTGTGKTAAFGLPLVELLHKPQAQVRALILVPTRELAIQVSGEILSLRFGEGPRVAPVYGGASIGEQFRRLKMGVDIVVGTPGRVLDHLERGTLDLSALEFLILDEADEMLDMGFIEDIETVLKKSRPERRVVLFSATMPYGILSVVKRHLPSYEIVEDFSEAVATELAEQVWLEVREGDRLEALCRVIDAEEDFYGIVFTSTRVEADRVAKALEERGYGAEALHGEITQEGRERILARFRDRRATVLVATDVAARGIDIEKLSHVVNWSLPHDPESYLHRVGRTGRAGNEGTAITFVTPEEYRKLFRFRKAAGSGLKKGKVPEIADVIGAKRDRLAARIIARAASFALHGEGEAEALPEAAASTAAVEEGDSLEAPAEAPADAAAQAAPAAPLPKAKAKTKASRKSAAKEGNPEAVALWAGLSEELLTRLEPKDALAAVLFEAFGGELDPARYREIQDASVDAAATARLFIGVGKAQGANPRTLAALIKRLSGIPDRLVGGIEVYESFSFANVPFEAAEKVIAEARRSGGLPPVRLATPRAGESRGPYQGSKGPRGPRPGYGARPEGAYQRGGPGPRPYAKKQHDGPPPHKAGPYKGGKPDKFRDGN
jgi:ATP-dependent RNA helicase DeaD